MKKNSQDLNDRERVAESYHQTTAISNIKNNHEFDINWAPFVLMKYDISKLFQMFSLIF